MAPRIHPLADARKRRDWSRKKLAERADLSVSTIARIENWDRLPSMDVMTKLASLFGWPAVVPEDWIEREERL